MELSKNLAETKDYTGVKRERKIKNYRNKLMTREELITKSKTSELQFQEVLDHIAEQYHYSPTSFQNGNLKNLASENQGSAKVLYFAKLNDLPQQDTLGLFAEHYQNVLENPIGEGHQNIRQFMANGWNGVTFDADVLTAK